MFTVAAFRSLFIICYVGRPILVRRFHGANKCFPNFKRQQFGAYHFDQQHTRFHVLFKHAVAAHLEKKEKQLINTFMISDTCAVVECD